MSTFDYNEKLHKDTINGNSKEQDRQKGLQEERERNIFILISALRELNIPNIQILEQLVNKYSLTPEEAAEKVNLVIKQTNTNNSNSSNNERPIIIDNSCLFYFDAQLHYDTLYQIGVEEGRSKSIYEFITSLKEKNVPEEHIAKLLVTIYDFTPEEASEAAKHNYAGCIIWLRSFNIIDDEISDLLINDLGYSPEQAKECLDNTKCFKKTRELNIKRRDK
ncbi:MAG: hypothetical protein E7257_06815 [Lachnospiraceae bacterium]|nr:hypothetical protein [Lachnospiraceae bacterium]